MCVYLYINSLAYILLFADRTRSTTANNNVFVVVVVV